MAVRAGIHGFCIHHYWFSGDKVLERPLEILLGRAGHDEHGAAKLFQLSLKSSGFGRFGHDFAVCYAGRDC